VGVKRLPDVSVGFVLGFALMLLIFLFSSDFSAHYEICEPANTGAKDCASYNVLSYALHKIGAALDALNGAITAIATAFIAWFTLSLRQSTDKLWDAGERQLGLLTESSASQSRDMHASIEAANEANELNRQGFESVHRPKIRIKHVIMLNEFWMDETLSYKIVFVNSGISPANLIECGIRSIICRREQLPETPEFETKTSLNLRNLPSGISMEIASLSDGHILTDRDNVEVRNGAKGLYVAGYILYSDVSGIRTTAFLRRLQISESQQPMRLLPTEDSDYNYED
jgi:hypothetical protein